MEYPAENTNIDHAKRAIPTHSAHGEDSDLQEIPNPNYTVSFQNKRVQTRVLKSSMSTFVETKTALRAAALEVLRRLQEGGPFETEATELSDYIVLAVEMRWGIQDLGGNAFTSDHTLFMVKDALVALKRRLPANRHGAPNEDFAKLILLCGGDDQAQELREAYEGAEIRNAKLTELYDEFFEYVQHGQELLDRLKEIASESVHVGGEVEEMEVGHSDAGEGPSMA